MSRPLKSWRHSRKRLTKIWFHLCSVVRSMGDFLRVLSFPQAGNHRHRLSANVKSGFAIEGTYAPFIRHGWETIFSSDKRISDPYTLPGCIQIQETQHIYMYISYLYAPRSKSTMASILLVNFTRSWSLSLRYRGLYCPIFSAAYLTLMWEAIRSRGWRLNILYVSIICRHTTFILICVNVGLKAVHDRMLQWGCPKWHHFQCFGSICKSCSHLPHHC